MRANLLTRTLVGVTALAGIAAGALAGASTGFAAPVPASQPAASSVVAAPAAVDNLGLNYHRATGLQCWLHNNDWGYNGAIDGQLGTASWMAMQRYLRFNDGYTGPIDGIVGSGTISALQRALRGDYGYTGGIDGIAGSGTKAAFARFADDMWEEC
ncbi:hypothetical protein SAMN05216223_101324 [Actinacidiphila yanglinensis]|uniref:Peptidoglycan binding domain-containing protein n=1 Tax=Actinacidiphila yanglinensis TaxID=310779 RepID=A0A1H5SYJ3_9ACTN|nr:peptidoglycan-binding domain-containing protein [Actinacidiphila yanglinensis]SEF55620.1 hypothetical protein SAMN05216223_101324 [Actinacidiphila yanglinensis]